MSQQGRGRVTIVGGGLAELATATDLGVSFTGKCPTAAGGFALARGGKHALPGGVVSLLTTSLFGVAAKLETARVLATLQKIDGDAWNGTTIREWTERRIRQPDLPATASPRVHSGRWRSSGSRPRRWRRRRRRPRA